MLLRLSLLMLLLMPLHAAVVVTSNERIASTIVGKTKNSVTIKLEDGSERTIERDRVVQIFDDNGDLVYTSPALLPNTKTEEQQPKPTQEKPLDNAVIIDGIIGGVTGGFYSEERRFVDALGIYAVYADGSRQNANNSMMTVGFGLHYEQASSLRWASLLSYLFRSTAHSVYTGDDQEYKRETLANKTVSTRHALLYGKELRFYPSDGMSSIDLIGQIGYEYGNYYPLAAYHDFRTKLSPVLPAYIVTTRVTIHGPTARLGSGISFRFSPDWQMRIQGFYQLTYSMATEKIWKEVDKNTLLHDFYAVFSVAYSF